MWTSRPRPALRPIPSSPTHTNNTHGPAAQVEAGLRAHGVGGAVARRFFDVAVGRDAARARMRDAFFTAAAVEGDGGGDRGEGARGRREAEALAESRRVGVEEVAAALAAPDGEWAFLNEPDPRTCALWEVVRGAVAAELGSGRCGGGNCKPAAEDDGEGAELLQVD